MDGEHRVRACGSSLARRAVAAAVRGQKRSTVLHCFFDERYGHSPESLQQFGPHVPHGFEQPSFELIETRAYLVKTPVDFRPSRLRSFRRTFHFLGLRPSRLHGRAGGGRALLGSHVGGARTATSPSQLGNVHYNFLSHGLPAALSVPQYLARYAFLLIYVARYVYNEDSKQSR